MILPSWEVRRHRVRSSMGRRINHTGRSIIADGSYKPIKNDLEFHTLYPTSPIIKREDWLTDFLRIMRKEHMCMSDKIMMIEGSENISISNKITILEENEDETEDDILRHE